MSDLRQRAEAWLTEKDIQLFEPRDLDEAARRATEAVGSTWVEAGADFPEEEAEIQEDMEVIAPVSTSGARRIERTPHTMTDTTSTTDTRTPGPWRAIEHLGGFWHRKRGGIVTPKRITTAWLRRHDACAEQVKIFEGEWPKGAPLTAANVRRAAELGLDLHWFANQVLPATALADYERATAPAQADYRRATATASADYQRATDTAWADYQRARTTASADYRRATATARADYERATAPALIDALGLTEEATA